MQNSKAYKHELIEMWREYVNIRQSIFRSNISRNKGRYYVMIKQLIHQET